MSEHSVLHLLQIHKAVQQWNCCKLDLRAGTQALAEAANCLRRCLDAWPQAQNPDAPQPDALSDGLPVLKPGCESDENLVLGEGGSAPDDRSLSCDARLVAPPAGSLLGQATFSSAAHAHADSELLALVCQELAQAQYLHALALCAAGQGAAADPWVSGLGYRLRLSDQVWTACADSVAATAGGKRDITDSAAATDDTDTDVGAAAAEVAAACGAAHVVAPLAALPACSPEQQEATWPLVSELQEHRTLPPATPLFCENVLSAGLLRRLATAFDPAGPTPYWRQHRYGRRSTPFFSYLYRLDQPPSSVVEEAIQVVHQRLLQSAEDRQPAEAAAAEAVAAVAGAVRGAVVAEWWAHTRSPRAAHQLHFDVNEDVLRRGPDAYRREHPGVSSVLFLPPTAPEPVTSPAGTAEAAVVEAPAAAATDPSLQRSAGPLQQLQCCPGGPTLVLDQTAEGARVPNAASLTGGEAPGTAAAPPLAPRAWPVGPRPNRLLLFPGGLLHGVLPPPPPPPPQQQQSSPQEPRGQPPPRHPQPGLLRRPLRAAAPRRTTLIIAWWGSERLRTASQAPPLVLSASGAPRSGDGGGAGGSDAPGAAGGGGSCTGREAAADGEGSRSLSSSGGDGGARPRKRQRRRRGEQESVHVSPQATNASDGIEEAERGRHTPSRGSSGSAGATSGGGSDRDSSSSSSTISSDRGSRGGGTANSSSGESSSGESSSGVLRHQAHAAEQGGGERPWGGGMGGWDGCAPHHHQQHRHCRHRRRVLGPDWRHAAPLRSGMLLPPSLPPKGSTPQPQPMSCGLTPLVPPTWRQWFSDLRARPLVPEPDAAGTLQQDGSALRSPVSRAPESVPLRWQVPACASPAWVAVAGPAGQVGGGEGRPGAGAAGCSSPVVRGAVGGSGAGGGAAGGGGGGGPSGAARDAAPPVQAAGGDDWSLARQVVRGMALALGLPPGLLAAERLQPPGAQQWREQPQRAGVAGCGGGAVMRALQLPELRLFLEHPEDLQRLYLAAPAPATTAAAGKTGTGAAIGSGRA